MPELPESDASHVGRSWKLEADKIAGQLAVLSIASTIIQNQDLTAKIVEGVGADTWQAALAHVIVETQKTFVVMLVDETIKFIDRATPQAERNVEELPGGRLSVEWALRRRRLVVVFFKDRPAKWAVANLAVDPWRESHGTVSGLADLEKAVADFTAG